jgi:DNA-binding NtrC family response regulator
MNGRILIADDDRGMCEMLESSLTRRGFAVTWRTSAEETLELAQAGEFDVLLTDLQMPGVGGLELCRRVSESRPGVPVIVITAFGSMDSAVAALRCGAYDFVSKPIDNDTLALTLDRAVKHRNLLERVKVLSETVRASQGFDELVGASRAMRRVYDVIGRIAGLDTSVLICGESGTGKELVARALHRNSTRRDGPFVGFNCTAIPESLLESELFGHKRGAFTDARADRGGLFVQASGGTLLLDEIADMPLALQPKLLRALEERVVRPVGGDRDLAFDVRMIAATNRDIDSLVADGRFREDLFYRLNVIRIDLPALRARDNDSLLLARHFLDQFASATGKRVTGIATSAAERLLAYPWPGNVRELRNCIERAMALTQYDKIVVDDLPPKVREHAGSAIVVASADPSELLSLEELERRYIRHVLNSATGNKTIAARILGLDRKTLYRKIEKYGLEGGSAPGAN